MTARHALATLAVLAALLPAGCRRAAPASPAAPAVPAAIDYRTFTAQDLEMLIRSKTGAEATLAPAGPNRFTGRIKAPDGTPLPLTVTVEAERVVCETKVGDSSTRQIITPRGVQSDLNMK
jgi:hypothetical protein